MPRYTPAIPLLAAVLATATLPACTHPANARLQLGALSTTPTFFTAEPPTQPVEPSTPRPLWNTTIIIAPIDGIAHSPTLRLHPAPRKSDPPRTYGLLPTATTALDHQSSPPTSTLLQTLDELGSSLTSLIDPFFLYYELTTPQSSPQRVWKRTRQDNLWSSGPPAHKTQDTPHD